MNKSKGFTLIELIITVAILGILAAIATSLYDSQSRKQRRSDGIIALTTAQGEMERDRADNGIFSLSGLDTTNSLKGYYSVNVVINNSGGSYTLTATAVGIQLPDTNCRQLILNDLGQLSSKNDAGTASLNCVPK